MDRVGYSHATALLRRLTLHQERFGLTDYDRELMDEEREKFADAVWRCSRCGRIERGPLIPEEGCRGCPDTDAQRVRWGGDNHWFSLVTADDPDYEAMEARD